MSADWKVPAKPLTAALCMGVEVDLQRVKTDTFNLDLWASVTSYYKQSVFFKGQGSALWLLVEFHCITKGP